MSRDLHLDEIQSVLFLGIGGIGMSALARYFMQKNIAVYGYDKTETELTRELSELGATITYQDDLELTKIHFDIIIYTPAIPKDSVLLQYFQNSQTPLLKRSEALGLITRNNTTIAVAGSHGKTTVSTMIAFVLKECGINVSAFLGGISVNFNSNYLYGDSEFVVVEADEFDKSFLRLSPDYIVLTSIDTDHLDIYGSREHIVESFQEFLNLLPPSGHLVYSDNVRDKICVQGTMSTYGFGNNDIRATDVAVYPMYSTFRVDHGSVEYRLNYNGRHNIENALAAISIAMKLGIAEEDIRIALDKFRGIKRRFEVIHQSENTIYIDDYAHHPTEIEALLQSVREIFPDKKILSIFQPHLYSRTQDLADDFAKSLDLSDDIILLPIYPARELPIEGVSSDLISKKMHKPVSIVDKADVISTLKSRPCEVILSIGAGDIATLVPLIKKHLE